MSNAKPGFHRVRLLQAAGMLLAEREYGNISGARSWWPPRTPTWGRSATTFGSKDSAVACERGDRARVRGLGGRGRQRDPRPGGCGAGGADGGLAAAVTLDEFDSMRPYFQAFIEALGAQRALTATARGKLAAHYRRQRDRVADWILEAAGVTRAPGARMVFTYRGSAPNLASMMLGHRRRA